MDHWKKIINDLSLAVINVFYVNNGQHDYLLVKVVIHSDDSTKNNLLTL